MVLVLLLLGGVTLDFIISSLAASLFHFPSSVVGFSVTGIKFVIHYSLAQKSAACPIMKRGELQ